jgi:hypothetical protein
MQAQGLQIPNHQVYGFASLLVPGLGHFLQRALFRGVLWLTGALMLWYLLSLSLSSWICFEIPPSLLAPVVALYHCASMCMRRWRIPISCNRSRRLCMWRRR